MRRRELVRAAVAAAGLTACDRARRTTPRSDEDVGGIEGHLAIYNWSDYIAPDTVENFAREFGVSVTYDTYESNEEMLAKLQAGATGYDIVVPSSYLLPALRVASLIQPLQRERLSNAPNIAPLFANPPYDPGNAYTVPWQWGVTGIAYRADLLGAARPDSQATFSDPRWAGRLTMMDDGRVVLGAMLKWRGHSINDTEPANLARAKADAIAAKRLLRAFKSAPVKADLIAGDVWIAQLWNGDAAQARAERDSIGFVVPKEGSEIWTDLVVLLADAPHPRAAHAFMNYVLRADVGASIADATGYGSPNAAAVARQERPIPYPLASELERLEYLRDVGPASATFDRLWTEIKSA